MKKLREASRSYLNQGLIPVRRLLHRDRIGHQAKPTLTHQNLGYQCRRRGPFHCASMGRWGRSTDRHPARA